MQKKDFFNNLDKQTLECMIKSLPINIFFKDLDNKYVFSSRNIEAVGKKSLESTINEKYAKEALEIDEQILWTGKGISYIRTLTDSENIKYVEIIKNPVFDTEGNIIGISGFVNDITTKVLLEQKLSDLANKDNLTGLYNRTYLNYWLRHENSIS